jgi:hypothetical protein
MRIAALIIGLLLAAQSVAARADDATLTLSIKNHRYVPDRLDVPAGVKFKLIVKNLDDTAEEFESDELKREKIVPAGGEIPVFLGPLGAGEYRFFGDFHQDTAQGVLVAK